MSTTKWEENETQRNTKTNDVWHDKAPKTTTTADWMYRNRNAYKNHTWNNNTMEWLAVSQFGFSFSSARFCWSIFNQKWIVMLRPFYLAHTLSSAWVLTMQYGSDAAFWYEITLHRSICGDSSRRFVVTLWMRNMFSLNCLANGHYLPVHFVNRNIIVAMMKFFQFYFIIDDVHFFIFSFINFSRHSLYLVFIIFTNHKWCVHNNSSFEKSQRELTNPKNWLCAFMCCLK